MDDHRIEPLPFVGAEAPLLADFAYALGERLTQANAEVARLNAAAIQSGMEGRVDAYERGVMDALRLVARAHAAVLDAQEEGDRTEAGRGSGRVRVLQHLARNRRPQRPKDIATALELTGPYVSRLLSELVAANEVSRFESSSKLDGRAVTYSLTENGEVELYRTRNRGLTKEAADSLALAQARLATARSLLESIRDRRRHDASRPRDLSDLDVALNVAREGNDAALALAIVAEKVTYLRQAGKTQQSGRALTDGTLLDLAHNPATAPDWNARISYEQGKRELAKSSGSVDSALLRFRSARELLKGRDSELRVWNDVAISECFRLTGRGPSALGSATIAHEAAKRAEDTYAVIRSGLQLGLAHRLMGEARECVDLLTNIQHLADERGFVDLAGECALQIGEAERYRVNYAEADEYLKLAMEMLKGRSTRRYALAWSASGALQYDLGHPDAASDVFRNVLLFCASDDLADVRALTHRRLGLAVAKEEDGDRTQALRSIAAAKRIYRGRKAVSTFGQLECAAGRMLVEPTRAVVIEACGLLSVLRTQTSETPVEVDAAGGRYKVIDRWVNDAFIGVVDKIELGKGVAGQAHSDLAALEDAGILIRNSPMGKSVMGKEPVLTR